jgi:hypothetical protein
VSGAGLIGALRLTPRYSSEPPFRRSSTPRVVVRGETAKRHGGSHVFDSPVSGAGEIGCPFDEKSPRIPERLSSVYFR